MREVYQPLAGGAGQRKAEPAGTEAKRRENWRLNFPWTEAPRYKGNTNGAPQLWLRRFNVREKI
ncbi:hypothetical protein D9X91_11485 [Falsibacillus albus]|uniref:Uncharacterized protein n=1 Tax=Falsibacillus albus TaxID=2478915 RepID=A0A3L7JWI6_9BACI|nr:hypothetical protein D9X91_11485 [Falsibacillus albus]